MLNLVMHSIAVIILFITTIHGGMRVYWWYWYNYTSEGKYEHMLDLLKNIKRSYPLHNHVLIFVVFGGVLLTNWST